MLEEEQTDDSRYSSEMNSSDEEAFMNPKEARDALRSDASSQEDSEEEEGDFVDDDDNDAFAMDDDDDDDEEEDEEEEEEVDGREQRFAWGKRKDTYYENEEDSDVSEEDAEAIAEEAKRIMEERALAVEEDEVGNVDHRLASAAERKAGGKNAGKGKGKLGKKSDAALLADFNKTLEETTLEMGMPGTSRVESVVKDTSTLSAADKIHLLCEDSPEMLELLQEFSEKAQDVGACLTDCQQQIAGGSLPTKTGVSYQEVRMHVLLNYVLNLAFFLLLKVGGKSVKAHPVIEQLVTLRVMMERMRPLDRKLKYQLEKLVQLAATQRDGANGAEMASLADPKANLQAMLCSSEDDDGDEDDHETNAGKVRGRKKKLKQSDDDDEDEKEKEEALYKPPRRVAAVFEDDKKKHRKLKEIERLKSRLKESALMKDIQREFGDAPIEEGNIGAEEQEDVNAAKFRAEIRDHEETYMTRMNLSKEDKKKLAGNKRKSGLSVLDDVTDYADVGLSLKALHESQGSDDEDVSGKGKNAARSKAHAEGGDESAKRKKLQDVLASLSRERKKTKGALSGEVDVQAPKSRSADSFDNGVSFNFPEEDAMDDDGLGVDDFGSDGEMDELYAEAQARKEARQAERSSSRKQQIPFYEDPSVEDGQKRAATREIVKNKGLVVKRKKEVRNSRVKYKNKYQKAMTVQRASLGRKDAGKERGAPYSGVSTGIKTNVSKSKRFRS